jgi:uncharacterized protein YjbI with pentapeptide repeats
LIKGETAEMAEEPRKDEQGVRQDHRLPHKAWVSLTTAVGRPLAVVLAVIAIVFILLLVVGLIWGLTWYLIPIFGSKEGLDVTQRKELVQGFASVVQALAVVLTGTVGLIGLLFTWRNLRQTRESTQRTLELTEQGQITERFTRAIDQLGDTDANEKPRLEIRLGGIYALERIDKESRERACHPTVMEVLTAYVRENSRRDNEMPLTATSVSNEEAEHDKGLEQDEYLQYLHKKWRGVPPPVRRPPTDIQAILDVLRRRDEDHVPQQQRVPLDLRGANLKLANLKGADLQLAILDGADLAIANFQQANLQQANLRGTALQKGSLLGANLTGAYLQEANLTGADLRGASLQEADLQEAILQEAILQGADLQGAILTGVKLQGADLQGAKLQGANLEGSWSFIQEADLEGAILTGVNLEGVNLQGAEVTDEQLIQAKSLEGATMPDGQKYEDWIKDKEGSGKDVEDV